MSDPRDEHRSDEGLQDDWLAPRAAPRRTTSSGTPLGGSLRDRSHGLRERTVPRPSLDAARARGPMAHRVAPPPPAPTRPPAVPAPGQPIKVVVSRPAPTTSRAAHPLGRRAGLSGESVARRLRELRLPEVHLSELRMPELHRPGWPLSRRATTGLSVALIAVVVSVASLALLVPGKPVVNPGTGSVNSVEFAAAARPPTGVFNFGPYFVSSGGRLLMMGSDGTTSSVWASSDGSNWDRLSSDGAFDAANRRFVVLGFSDDGNGGFVAVGDSFVKGARVAASAWHSRDGRQWVPSTIDFPENAEMVGLAARPGALVAAGNGVAWVSQDGSSWTMVALPGATGYVPRAVRTWSAGFAILAVWGGAGERQSAAWVSSDGRSWVQATAPLALFNVEDAIGYGGGLVAVGSQTRSAAELATPTPKPTPTPKVSGAKPKVTPKPAKTPAPTPVASGAPGASRASPGPSPTPQTFEAAGTWSSPDGVHWYRGAPMGGPRAQSIVSVTQAFDSLVAIGSEPDSLPGQPAPAAGTLTLWITDNGADWKPLTTSVAALSRGQLIQFGSHLVMAGVTGSALSVLTGTVTLGEPLPPVAATPTPVFSLLLNAGGVPMIAGLGAGDTLGPVVGSKDRFFAFINRKDGTGVWASNDGKTWTQEAKPADLTAGGPKGTPLVLDAASDGQGGVVAVGKITTASGDNATVWRLSGDKWTRSTITGAAPAELGSVATHNGHFAAAASVDGGARMMASEDGATWVEAAIPGASGYTLSVSPYSGGFVAYGTTATSAAASAAGAAAARIAVWTSDDGLSWTAQSWTLPPNTGAVMGSAGGLVATTTGITGNTSWWWSADGKAWQDARLTTVPGGCFSLLDAGLVAIVPPASASTDTSWSAWVSKDGQSWQRPQVNNLTFGVTTDCRVATVGQRVVIVGWQKAGVLQDFYGQLGGL